MALDFYRFLSLRMSEKYSQNITVLYTVLWEKNQTKLDHFVYNQLNLCSLKYQLELQLLVKFDLYMLNYQILNFSSSESWLSAANLPPPNIEPYRPIFSNIGQDYENTDILIDIFKILTDLQKAFYLSILLHSS